MDQLPFSVDSLKQADLFDPFVREVLLQYSSPNAPRVPTCWARCCCRWCRGRMPSRQQPGISASSPGSPSDAGTPAELAGMPLPIQASLGEAAQAPAVTTRGSRNRPYGPSKLSRMPCTLSASAN